MDIVWGILWIICSFAVWIIYHQIFDVYYGQGGCLRELVGVGVVGGIVAALVIAYWYVALIVIAIVIYCLVRKS